MPEDNQPANYKGYMIHNNLQKRFFPALNAKKSDNKSQTTTITNNKHTI